MKLSCLTSNILESLYLFLYNLYRNFKAPKTTQVPICLFLKSSSNSNLWYLCHVSLEILHWYFGSFFEISEHLICRFFSLFYLLIQHKYPVFGLKTSKSSDKFASWLITSRLVTKTLFCWILSCKHIANLHLLQGYP